MSRVSKFAAYQRQQANKNETAQARKGSGMTPTEKTLATPAVVVTSPRSQVIPEVVAQVDHEGKEKKHKHSKQTQLPHVPQGSNEAFPSGVNTGFWEDIDFHVNKAADRVGEAVKRGRELEEEVVELRKLKQRVEDSVINEQILKAQNEELKHTNEDLNNKLQNTTGLMMKLGEDERMVKTLTKKLKKAEKERLTALKKRDSFRQKRDSLLREHNNTIVLLRQAEDSKRKLAFELAKVKKQFDDVEKLHKEAEEDCVAIGQEQFDNAISQILALNPGAAIRTDGATSIGLVEGCNIINAETKEVLLPLPHSASKIVSPMTCFSSTTPS